ncbi:MAG TPA: diadenylate cyclase, partial [Treponemataceae bacterium]|nr:diadenylate cyclase [Treponemataceae bacterium]
QDIKKSFGTRHRAALGLAEKTDAVTLIVSEETGALSLAYDSKLFYDLDTRTISKMLEQLLKIKAETTSQGGKLNENTSAD